MARLDWPGLLRAGLQGLHLHPDAFWRLTPMELKLMLGADSHQAALTRADLDALAAAFPDQKGNGSDDRYSRDGVPDRLA